MKFQLVSDLHIDYWPAKSQIDWEKNKTSDIIVVAGDISDDLEMSLQELRRLAEVYKHVLFIDGNHEHDNYFCHDLDDPDPDMLLAVQAWQDALKEEPNIHYLHDNPFVLDGVAFVGRNGWWDFSIAEPYVTQEEGYNAFASWHNEGDVAAKALVNQATRDAKAIRKHVQHLQEQEDIVSIVVVTHTPPHPNLVRKDSYPMSKEVWASCYGNRSMAEIPLLDYQGKIQWWLYGHNHEESSEVIGPVHYLAHPRGKPKDFNRENYKPKTLSVASKSDMKTQKDFSLSKRRKRAIKSSPK